MGQADDADGDGYTECDGDCNDGNAGQHPDAVELCNGFDDDCSGIADDGFGDLDADLVADCRDNCPQTPNGDQYDFDADGYGEVCETGAMRSDIDVSSRVDGFDLGFLARAFGAYSTQDRYHFGADLNRDGIVDGEDLALLAVHWGEIIGG